MPEKKHTLLVINPGSTSTKISVYDDEISRFERSVRHEASELLQFPHVNDQVPMRCRVIEEMLAKEGVSLSDIDVFIGRGGSAHTQPGGVTVIDDAFNTNPRSSKEALKVLSSFPGRRIIVTPGMVELGAE